jgi:predicted DNA-binding transcriptional regulator YafY
MSGKKTFKEIMAKTYQIIEGLEEEGFSSEDIFMVVAQLEAAIAAEQKAATQLKMQSEIASSFAGALQDKLRKDFPIPFPKKGFGKTKGGQN